MKNNLLISLSCLCLVFVIFYSHFILDVFGPDNYQISKKLEKELSDMELEILDPMEKTLKTINLIQEICGDLCNTSKEIKPGEFMGSVTAKVDCKTLFQSAVLHQPSYLPPQSWGQLPQEMQEMFSYGGRIGIRERFFDNALDGVGRNEATVFTKQNVEDYINAWQNGNPFDNYFNASNMVGAAADYVDVSGKTILVVGTQNPWVEAVLLSKKPKKVVTLEYGYFISEYPGFSFMRPGEFRERYLNGTLDSFDVIFSYSSIEHPGHGRYGDPLNPWGDILAVAELWCVSTKDAKLALGVATTISRGFDTMVFNSARVYGPLTYPFLTTNWKFVWPTRDIDREDPDPTTENLESFQPVFVFEKNHQFWG